VDPVTIFPNEDSWRKLKIAEYKDLIVRSPGKWVQTLEAQFGGRIYGGYLEDRSPLFDIRHDPEALIHLGLDFWMPENTSIHSHVEGVVCHTAYEPDILLGWGGRIDIKSADLVYIFGHLKRPEFIVGDLIRKGQTIGKLGKRSENGGWLPHLHIQAVRLCTYNTYANPNSIDAYAKPKANLPSNFPEP